MATYTEHIFRYDEEGVRAQLLFSTSLKGEHKNQIHEVWLWDDQKENLRSFCCVTTDELEKIGLACLRVANFTKGWNNRHFDELYY